MGAAATTRSSAGNGDDALLGGPGDDRETGGAGRDRFDQGQAADGADRLDGGGGTDTVDYRGRHAKLTITVGKGANDGEKGEGDNVVKTVEIVFGGSGADKLTAGVKAAVLHGGDGTDTLTGGKGKDYLDGGGGLGHGQARRARATASSPARSCDSDPRRRHGRYAPRAAAPGPAARGAARGVRSAPIASCTRAT